MNAEPLRLASMLYPEHVRIGYYAAANWPANAALFVTLPRKPRTLVQEFAEFRRRYLNADGFLPSREERKVDE